jgi:hypothetical protein
MFSIVNILFKESVVEISRGYPFSLKDE